ncbi:MAG: AGCS family alanine or glycine:cation symporter [Polyangiales bacterium]|jgi:AGCS family alanine or glycine:cation symporter
MTAPMDVFAVVKIARLLWMYAAGPLLLVAAVVLTVRLKAPQFRKLGAGFRALKSRGEGDGMTSPGLTAALASAGQIGAAAAVGAGTGIALGGPGVIPYLWIFCLVMAPLRYAETLFAGTDAPGGGDASESGSMPRRLLRLGGRWRIAGMLLALCTLVATFAYGGVMQSIALADATEPLLPGSATVLVLGAAGVGGLLAALGKRTLSIAGWLGVLGLTVLLVACIWAIGSAPGAAFAALGSAFGAAFDGSPRYEAFGGALAGEVTFAALLHILPATAAPTGIDGALQSTSTGGVRAQAAASLLGPVGVAVLGTLLCMAMVGTGAYGTSVETRLPIPEAMVLKVPASSSAERFEEDRWFSGYMRIRAGQARNPAITYNTTRGSIEDSVLLYNGRAADIALHVEDGRAFRILRNTTESTLSEVGPSNLWRVEVQGQMPPRGGALLIATADTSGGDLAARILLVALLALGAAAFALFGLGASRSLPKSVPAPLRALLCFVPLAGATVALVTPFLGLGALASIAAAVFVALASLVLLLRSGEIAALDR